MKIGILKETQIGDKRVSISPRIAQKLVKEGFKLLMEEGAGIASSFHDEYYIDAGVQIEERKMVFKLADVLIKINPFDEEDLKLVRKGQVLISQMFHMTQKEWVKEMASYGLSAFSMDAMPRTSIAQEMDVLSSQNNLAGYKSVILGAFLMKRIMPLMMTAAGTIKPARVLIFGVGVAGLQAIATAKRLGAIVTATDIRPETKEQAESLGAQFILVDNGGGHTTEGGYAKEASEEFMEKQKEAVNKTLFLSDLVITTASVPGKKAPVLISKEQILQMKNGAVIIDLAANQGGNCELSEYNETKVVNGVTIVGTTIAPESVSTHASDLYAKNTYNFLKHLTKDNQFKWDLEDNITDETLIIHNGTIRKS